VCARPSTHPRRSRRFLLPLSCSKRVRDAKVGRGSSNFGYTWRFLPDAAFAARGILCPGEPPGGLSQSVERGDELPVITIVKSATGRVECHAH
jgi:hypothetical protein